MIKHLQFVTYWGYFFFRFLHTTQNWKGEKHKLSSSSSSSSLQMELLSSNLELHPQPADGIFLAPIFRCTHKQQLANGNFWVPIFRDPSIVATACRWNLWVPIFRCTHSCSNAFRWNSWVPSFRCSSSTGATACRALSIFRYTVPQQQQQQM